MSARLAGHVLLTVPDCIAERVQVIAQSLHQNWLACQHLGRHIHLASLSALDLCRAAPWVLLAPLRRLHRRAGLAKHKGLAHPCSSLDAALVPSSVAPSERPLREPIPECRTDQAIGPQETGGAWGPAEAFAGEPAAAALEGIARNPQAAGKIQTPMLIGLVFMETLVLFTFGFGFLMLGNLG